MTDVPRDHMQAGRHNWNLSKSLMLSLKALVRVHIGVLDELHVRLPAP